MPLPRGERVFSGYLNRKGERLFVITAKEARDYYFLYAVDGNTYTKLGRAKNPLELVEKYKVIEKINEE